MTSTPPAFSEEHLMVQATNNRPDTSVPHSVAETVPNRPEGAKPGGLFIETQRHGLNITRELDNLHHKLRLLRVFAKDKQLLSRVPILSEVEEARHLQYQIECIEAICLEQGHNLRDLHVIDTGDLAPSGFSDWLTENYSNHDPVIRAWDRSRESATQSNNHGRHRPCQQHFLKCADEGCIHYIYGFLEQEELHQHRLSHTREAKRDSGLSIGDPTFSSPFFLEPMQGLPSFNRSTLAHGLSSPTRLSTSSHHSDDVLRLPSLYQTARQKNQHGSAGPTRFSRSTTNISRPHDPIGAGVDVDPQLPPLKRSRVGPSRLESIGELRLLRDANDCLRCISLQIECISSCDTCPNCGAAFADESTGNFWKILGCHRGPLSIMASGFVPTFLCPDRVDSPMASPLAQRQSMNHYLEKTYALQTVSARVVQANLDFDDAFWWTDDLAFLTSTNLTYASSGDHVIGRPPPVLRVLASSRNISKTAYNFWQLLKLSGLLSDSRHAEKLSFPPLYRAKLVLREVLFFALQQPNSCIVSDTYIKMDAPNPDEYDCYGRYRLVISSIAQFLDSIETLATKRDARGTKSWLAVFLSICIFSIARTILNNMILFGYRSVELPSDRASSAFDKGDAVYKASIAIIRDRLPTLLDLGDGTMQDDDRELYCTAAMIVKRGVWHDAEIASTASFLTTLGSFELEGGMLHGFLRLVRPKDNPGLLHHPLAIAGHTNARQRRHSPESGEAVPGLPSKYTQGSDWCGGSGSPELVNFSGNNIKGWVCTDPGSSSTATVLQPSIPLSKCETCVAAKIYGAHDDAAAHLRQAHFSPSKVDKSNSEWPSMSILRDWMREISLSKDTHQSSQQTGPLLNYGQAASVILPTVPAKSVFTQAHPAIQDPSMESTNLQMPRLRVQQQVSRTLLPQTQTEFRATVPVVPTAELDQFYRAGLSQTESSTNHKFGNSFLVKGDVQRHIDQNRCPHPECGRVYKDIAAHMLTHMEERPEKCPIEACEYHTKGFARKYDKNRHALTHFKGNMVCPFCSGTGTAYEKAFNRADVFKRHLTAVHNVEQVPPNSKKTPTRAGGYRLLKPTEEEGRSVRHGALSATVCSQPRRASTSIWTTASSTSLFLLHQRPQMPLPACILRVARPQAQLRPPQSTPKPTLLDMFAFGRRQTSKPYYKLDKDLDEKVDMSLKSQRAFLTFVAVPGTTFPASSKKAL